MWLLLLMNAVPDELVLPPKVQGDVTATLSVRVADQTPQPGTARVRLRLTAEGRTRVGVEGPRLDDALDGWRVATRESSTRPDGRHWECTLDLEQVKPGVVPLPGVRITVRAGAAKEEFIWPELLHEAADVAPVVEVPAPPPSPWPGRFSWAGLSVLGLLVVAGAAYGARRWATRARPALPPLEAALAAIDLVRASRADPPGLVAELDGVLRAYLETRGIPATRSTAVELRGRLGDVGGGGLAPILAKAEECKFAGFVVSREEVVEMAEGAHRALRSIVETGQTGACEATRENIGNR